MGVTNRELELKLELTGDELGRIEALAALRDLAIGEPASQQLRSLYFDTLDRRLHARGLSLRIRRVGESWLQTLKFETDMYGGISRPGELETIVEGPKPEVQSIPDKVVRKRVKKAIGEAPLVPLFETVVERTARRLKELDGTEIELALDKGVVRGAEGSRDLCEAELELKSGNPDALVCVAEKLFADGAIRLSEASKAEWGYRLGDRQKQVKLEPLKASMPKLDATQSCAEAFREICRTATDHILHNWVVVAESDDPEGTHQMRIGLRRLRSLLKVFRPVVDSEGLRELDRKARDLGLLLGELRDADVAMDTVGAAAAQRSDDADLASLKGVLANSRAHHREKVRAELKGRQWSCLKLKLAMLPECLDQLVGGENSKVLAKPIGRLTDKVLGKWWRKIIQAGRRIDSLSAAERHEMRKRLKTMRYAVEFLASLYPAKDVRRFTKKLRSLQDKFGYLNDVVVAEKLKLVRADGTSDPGLQRAGGYVIGWHAARAERAWNNIRSGWKRFAKSSPFWA